MTLCLGDLYLLRWKGRNEVGSGVDEKSVSRILDKRFLRREEQCCDNAAIIWTCLNEAIYIRVYVAKFGNPHMPENRTERPKQNPTPARGERRKQALLDLYKCTHGQQHI